jgi:hypothetical protein
MGGGQAVTKYQPIHVAGDLGPAFNFMTEANLWILGQPDPRWTVQIISAPPMAQAA